MTCPDTESNTVKQMIPDIAMKLGGKPAPKVLVNELPSVRWRYVLHTEVLYQLGGVIGEPRVREALIGLTLDIPAPHDRTNEVLYNLSPILLTAKGNRAP